MTLNCLQTVSFIPQRRAEFRDKLAPAIAKALGNRIPELISLDGLSTAPEKQGLGYAGSLVNQLAAMVGSFPAQL